MIILTDQVNEEKPSHLKTQPHTHAGRVGAALFGLSLYVIFFWFVRYSELHWWKAWPEQFPRLIFSNSDAPIYTLARKCGDSAKPKSEIKWNAAHTTHTAQSGKSEAQERETFFFYYYTHSFCSLYSVHCSRYRMCIWFVDGLEMWPITHWQVSSAFGFSARCAAVDDLAARLLLSRAFRLIGVGSICSAYVRYTGSTGTITNESSSQVHTRCSASHTRSTVFWRVCGCM